MPEIHAVERTALAAGPRGRGALALLLVLAAAWLPFLPLLGAGFAFDDRAQIFANEAVQRGDLSLAWSRGYWANVAGASETFVAGGDLYRPLTTSSLLLAHVLHGDRPLGYHVENLLIHALTSLLIWRLLLRWRFAEPTALLAAMLFALAPIAVEPVASIAQRAELLAAAGSALCLLALARERAALAGAALLAALFAKEGAIIVPLLALLADRALLGRRDGLAPLARRYAPFALACALYLAARYAVLGRIDLGGSERATYFTGEEWPLRAWLTQAGLFWTQVLPGALLGFPLVFDWSRGARATAAADDTTAWFALGALLVAALALLALTRRRPRLGFAPLFFALAYLPTANLLLPIGVLFAPRLLYWPHLGSALLLAFGARAAIERARIAPRHAALLLALPLLLLAARSAERSALWRSPEELYAATLQAVPENSLVRLLHAQELAARAAEGGLLAATRDGLYAEALGDLEIALSSDPQLLAAHAGLLVRCALACEQEERLVHALDGALRALPHERPHPLLPALEALRREPLEEFTLQSLRAWGRAIADAVPAEGELALIGMAALLLPDYLDARALRRPVSQMLDQRARERSTWSNQHELFLLRAGNEMKLALLRLQRAAEALVPVASEEARGVLLEPLRARAASWLAVLEEAAREAR